MHADKELIKKTVEEKVEFVKRCGLKLEEVEKGYVKCVMPAQGNQNHIGTMYAGALFTLAEIPGGALWLSSFDITKSYPILKSFNIDFLRPAKGDIAFETGFDISDIERLSKECADRGKAEFVLEGELKDSDGTTVARSKGTYLICRN